MNKLHPQQLTDKLHPQQITNKQLETYLLAYMRRPGEATEHASWGLPDIAVPAWAAAVPLSTLPAVPAVFNPEHREVHRKHRLIVPAVLLTLALMLGLMFVVGFVLVFTLLIALLITLVLGVAFTCGYGYGYGFGVMRGYGFSFLGVYDVRES